ncbi:MAG: Eco57I restriction-modification methylase domain-containing protein, partial [Conexivisphaera sp.]
MSNNTPVLDMDDIVNCIKTATRQATNEEEVRHQVSKCIEDKILKPLGITQYGAPPHYEYTLVSGARIDALYGHVIIEYKAPGKLSSSADVMRARDQLIKYIGDEAASQENWDRYLGIMISDRIGFLRYYKSRGWVLRGPYEISRESVVKLVEAIRGLRRKALRVDLLVEDFGPRSKLAGNVKVLYERLLSPRSPRTGMLFEEWLRLLRQATGYSPGKLGALRELAENYGIEGEVDYDRLMFAIHTYYALILKLLAAEVAYLYGGGRFHKSYIAELDDAYTRGGAEALGEALRDLEGGGIFRQFGVENFLEGDYFSWYLGELDQELGRAVAEIVRRLEDFEPATPQLEPEFARDLLKRLYQQLIPEDIRHNMGEYYTPDWLADLLLDEVGLSLERMHEMGSEYPMKPLEARVLDPACGSGTFLVRYIARLRDYAREHFLEDVLSEYVLKNVVGYDLNPLAVLTARTNYLMMIADLPRRGSLEIPVYLADSLVVERSTKLLEGDVYVLRTVAGEFRLPVGIVTEGILSAVLDEAARALKSRYTREDFENRIRHLFREVSDNDARTLGEFYGALLRLEQEGKNDVWVSIIRNAFAPMLKGKFDYVVGNPPWVRWEDLPDDYREITKPLWENVYALTGGGAGRFKRDLAMLFLARSFDLYLKPGGRLGFLMPFTVFKTQAGAGFRRFLATRTKVNVVHDLVTLYPFEGAVNRTSAVIVEKVCEVNKATKDECPALEEMLNGN